MHFSRAQDINEVIFPSNCDGWNDVADANPTYSLLPVTILYNLLGAMFMVQVPERHWLSLTSLRSRHGHAHITRSRHGDFERQLCGGLFD